MAEPTENPQRLNLLQPRRRTILLSAVATVGATVAACGGGSDADTPTPTAATGTPAPPTPPADPASNTDPAAPETEAPAPEVPDPVFAEPASMAEFMSTMRIGIQATDYLENANLSAGANNKVDLSDFSRMRDEGGFDHVRIPANCAARADVNGLISEAYLVVLDAQVDWALRRMERVMLDPLHGYAQWRGDHGNDSSFDDIGNVAPLTADQHARRATAMWLQLATRYQDRSLRLSFDLFNEPLVRQTAGYPAGLTAAQLNDWHAEVIPLIRATGGKNADRVIWMEPWSNRLDLIRIPANAGPVGLSAHTYTPFDFTHRTSSLTAGGMTNLVEDLRWAKRWATKLGVPMWIGECGASRNVSVGTQPRNLEERAEYLAHVRAVVLAEGLCAAYWGYNGNFGIYDQRSQAWLPYFPRAVSAVPEPYPVRALPSFTILKGGRVALGYYQRSTWAGFSYDPYTGVLTSAENTTGDHLLTLVFPEIPVGTDQTWTVRAVDSHGNWEFGNFPAYHDATLLNYAGTAGLDVRAKNPAGGAIYSKYLAPTPGGYDNAYGPVASSDTFLAVEIRLKAGSPAGYISFMCLRTD
ncbi:glycoside hydrolase family 5 protein [Xylophilus sp. GOD-11R]|uniref:glycoside hydrolase family 5 protein n=1 Tax=Xylophilus sp. GOD-11R TaxID=3089814 RepID=UPI00298CFBD9|nr:cellulase family glycosylhydrolase [Xylophilus sp. GOD-11R]WPB56374.1 cellulase family glycosylhydrolase [Xylophilus sp. GOD-11R]